MEVQRLQVACTSFCLCWPNSLLCITMAKMTPQRSSLLIDRSGFHEGWMGRCYCSDWVKAQFKPLFRKDTNLTISEVLERMCPPTFFLGCIPSISAGLSLLVRWILLRFPSCGNDWTAPSNSVHLILFVLTNPPLLRVIAKMTSQRTSLLINREGDLT